MSALNQTPLNQDTLEKVFRDAKAGAESYLNDGHSEPYRIVMGDFGIAPDDTWETWSARYYRVCEACNKLAPRSGLNYQFAHHNLACRGHLNDVCYCFGKYKEEEDSWSDEDERLC